MFNHIKGFYPTPPEVIERMISPYIIENSRRSYHKYFNTDYYDGDDYKVNFFDPQGGKGDILDYLSNINFRAKHGHKYYAVEIEPDLQKILREKRYRVVGDDFLKFETDLLFDFIIMNPPFSNGASQVICIRIKKNEEPSYYFDGEAFDSFENRKIEFPNGTPESQLVIQDTLQALEDRYNASITSFKEMVTAMQKFKYYAVGPLIAYADNYIKLADDNDMNQFIEDFNESCWNKVLNESKFKDFMTGKVRNEFIQKFAAQKDFAFTKQNMFNLFEMMFCKRGDILNDCILEVFDIFTKNHVDNRTSCQGWKTNDAYRVNRRVILPDMIGSSYDGTYYISKKQTAGDIDKAMCYLSGKKFTHIRSIERTVDQSRKRGQLIESEFFTMRYYMIGTLHLTFKDEVLWRRFNTLVSELRGYPLPDDKGQSFYRKSEKKQQQKQREEREQQEKKGQKSMMDFFDEAHLNNQLQLEQ